MGIKNLLNHLNRRDTRLFPYFTKLTLILLLISSVFFVGKILAQDNLLKDTQDAIKEGTNQEAWLDNGLSTNMVSGLRAIVGDVPDDVLNGTATSWIPSGALGVSSYTVASLFTPQASGVEYIAQAKDSFLGKPVYAQGFGFKGLQPVLPIWRAFRNVTYILSSLVFIVIGLMIVLRVKVSQQAVISVQNAIPQLLATLLLITFSYAIAGLLIDLSTLIQGITISTLFSGTGTNLTDSLLKEGPGPGFRSFLSHLFGGQYDAYDYTDLMSRNGFLQTVGLTSKLVPIGLTSILGGLIGASVGAIIGVFAGGITAGPGALIGGGAGVVLINLIIAIMILVAVFKLLLGLIKVYITIIFKIILSPLEIGLGAFPGSKVGFSSWILELFANILVFPIVLIFLVVANLIQEQILGGNIWVPQQLGAIPDLLLGAKVIAALFGVGALLILAKLPEMIPQYIFMIKPSPWGQAIGQATDLSKNPVYRMGKGAAGTALSNSATQGDIAAYIDKKLGGPTGTTKQGLRTAVKGGLGSLGEYITKS